MANLILKKLVKRYDKTTTVHGIDLDIQSGELIVLVGPSGCGKSTVLRMIAGLEEVSSGDIYIEDENVIHTSASKRGIAMVFQSYALYPHMTVKENLAFGLKNMKCSKEYINEQINHAADILQLSEYLDRTPSQLSGGQRQRIAIGRAIVRNPKIFLFDEPLSNLDAELRVQMRHELTKLHRKLGNTMVYVTHDQVEAMTMADRIVVLNEGKIAQVGSPLELYNHPNNIFTASFIGSPKINLVPAEITRNLSGNLTISLLGKQTLMLETKHLAINNKVTIGIRPEHVTTEINNENITLEFTLDEIESLGDSTYLYAKLFGKHDFRIKLEGQHKCKPGESLKLAVNPINILLFDAQGEAIHLSKKQKELN
ncbi:MAG: sn-glycerol-3-phosphate ABC transporter ATP-binding protein UgpC [Colwellia sp.]